MKRIAIVLLILLLLSSCSAQETVPETQAPEMAMKLDALTITGDVLSPLLLENPLETSLFDVLQEAQPQGEEITVILHAYDGVMAEIPYEQTEKIVLSHSPEKGWHAMGEEHPPQAGIREIETIVVRAKTLLPEQRSVRILSGEHILHTWSFGDLFMASSEAIVIEEGTATRNEQSVTAHTLRRVIPLSDYFQQETSLQLYSQGSIVQNGSSEGYIEWRGHQADYLSADLKTRLPDITGLWADAPSLRIDQIAWRILEAVEHERVMLILLDGLGQLQYETLKDQLPFLSSADTSEIASTTMPSVSSVALASLLTGMQPAENGVDRERIRRVEVPDLFDELMAIGKESVMIEGSVKLIDFSIPQRLHADENNSGTTDDEVFAGARKALGEEIDFLFVHFHGYDDLAHTYGPYSPEAIAGLVEIDTYVQELASAFDGRLIVTADHGQHDIQGDKKGEHGEFRPSDMMIPVLEWR